MITRNVHPADFQNREKIRYTRKNIHIIEILKETEYF